ncbi:MULTISPECIES: Fur family transcriptional regulator [unclassified Streptomyces]|uniref:Fur family transcriptional regulator n=1 Tax=unclassified Streptomyces TaxID=2593676 RepID=UPI0036FE8F6C
MTERSTRQRAAVVAALTESLRFVSARHLHGLLSEAGAGVGRTTVYRVLRHLEVTGRVDVVQVQGGERLFRLRGREGHRHHLICRLCRVSRAVDARSVERWAVEVAGERGFTAVEHTVELVGVCGPCHARRPRVASP